MPFLYSYRDTDIYTHHSLTPSPSAHEFPMHAHEWLEILYFISGKGNYLVEGNQYPLEPGDVFILRPAEMHKLDIDPSVPYERIVIHFSPELLKDLDPDKNLLRPFFDRPLGQFNRYSSVDDAAGLLRSAFAAFDFRQVSDVRLNLIGRLIMLLTVMDNLHGKTQTHAPVEGLAGQILAYVNEHLFETISIQSIADAFYRSPSQVSRIFQQATGNSLWKYVTIKRLMTARALIQNGEPAAVAASACGFSEYSSFYRAYKAQFGHSPKEDTVKQQ